VVKPFPKEPVKVPPKWRGKPLYDAEDCTGCRQCERVCPPGAITIEDKKGEFFHYKIDYGVCIYCWYCIDACPTTALTGDDKLAFMWALIGLKRGLKVVCLIWNVQYAVRRY